MSLLTNLTPNHLDRYGTFEAYCAAKEGLFSFQTLDENDPAVSIFNAEDPIARPGYDKYRSQPGRICRQFSADDVGSETAGRVRSSRPGQPVESRGCHGDCPVLRRLGPIHHGPACRLSRPCRTGLNWSPRANGVRWYNDSKATTPEGTMVALSAFDCPKILIAGGYDKHTPFDELGEKIASGAKAAILIGQTARMIADAIRAASQGGQGLDVRFAGSWPRRSSRLIRLAAPGDVVLLSPACASYDMFENYQQRGRLFGELARAAVSGSVDFARPELHGRPVIGISCLARCESRRSASRSIPVPALGIRANAAFQPRKPAVFSVAMR